MNRGREWDPAFLESLRQRDQAAVGTAVQLHARALFTICRALGFDGSDSEHLVQDTLTTFLETLDRFEGRSTVRTWLVGILYRKTQEKRRTQARDSKIESLDDDLDSRFNAMGRWSRPPEDIETLLASKEVLRVMENCLERIPAQQRTAFVLREIEQMDTPTICGILGVSETNLGVLLHRARHRLRECLEAKGITPSHV